jgi:hypothetical protein
MSPSGTIEAILCVPRSAFRLPHSRSVPFVGFALRTWIPKAVLFEASGSAVKGLGKAESVLLPS